MVDRGLGDVGDRGVAVDRVPGPGRRLAVVGLVLDVLAVTSQDSLAVVQPSASRLKPLLSPSPLPRTLKGE